MRGHPSRAPQQHRPAPGNEGGHRASPPCRPLSHLCHQVSKRPWSTTVSQAVSRGPGSKQTDRDPALAAGRRHLSSGDFRIRSPPQDTGHALLSRQRPMSSTSQEDLREARAAPASPRPSPLSPAAYSRAISCHTWHLECQSQAAGPRGPPAGLEQLTPQTSTPLMPSLEVSRVPVTKGHSPPRARRHRLCGVPVV